MVRWLSERDDVQRMVSRRQHHFKPFAEQNQFDARVWGADQDRTGPRRNTATTCSSRHKVPVSDLTDQV